ncbi:MAG TPA: hypothetical protein VL574_06885 [Stellaceae bacterium]|nr:hypothetical protein [Stellaceae bacterium]
MRSAPLKGNLIVTNMPASMTSGQLAELFDSFGLVIGAEIRHIPSNSGELRLGVIALAPEDAVERAIEAVNKTVIDNCRIKVGRAKTQPRKASASAARPAQPRAAAGQPLVSQPHVSQPYVSQPYISDAAPRPRQLQLGQPLRMGSSPSTAAPTSGAVRTVIVEHKPRRRIVP